MLGPPIDAWYVWLGVSVAALAVLGVATTATPDAPTRVEPAAETVETVAATEPPSSGRHPVDADAVRIDAHRIRLPEGDGWSAAVVRAGPITPAQRGTALREVALGAHPETAFDSPEAFRAAARDARAVERTIEPAGDELVVRSVAWEDVDVTLVTA